MKAAVKENVAEVEDLMQEAAAAFAKMAALDGGDDWIRKDELISAMHGDGRHEHTAAHRTVTPTPITCTGDFGLFAKLDVDEDGEVTLDEFMDYFRDETLRQEKEKPGKGISWVKGLLHTFATNMALNEEEGRGVSFATKANDILNEVMRLRKFSELKALFGDFDLDGDGYLRRQEAVEAVQEYQRREGTARAQSCVEEEVRRALKKYAGAGQDKLDLHGFCEMVFADEGGQSSEPKEVRAGTFRKLNSKP